MSFLSDCRRLWAASLFLVLALAAVPAGAATPVLRVCSDPNNLPFSNQREEGFENRIAELVARDLGMRLSYFWFPQRRSFVRRTLGENRCDVIIGIPSSGDRTAATRPYYRSTYVFVTRRDRRLDIRSLDDPRLHRLKVGVQMIGADYASSPPAHALANRGIVSNVTGFMVYGDSSQVNPARRIIDAVANGEVDVATVWGPTAGYFIAKSAVPLTATPVTPQIDPPFLPFVFDISMGVRRGDAQLKDRLEGAIERHQREIDAILRQYGVPRLDVSVDGADS